MKKVYRVYEKCHYYGDISEVGIFSSKEKAEEAIEIRERNSGIGNWRSRISVDEVNIDEMPYDREKEKQ